jgi:hypothetical protein
MEQLTLIGKQESALIRSCDGRVRYKLAHLRSLYVLCHDTPEEFSEKFNLDIEAVNRAIREGGWEVLRGKYNEGDVNALLRATREKLQDLYENEIAQFDLQTFQERQQVEALLQHRARFGDLFMHDPITGDVKLDVYGQPIPLPLPNTPGRTHAKIKSFELLEGLTRCLAAIKHEESVRTGSNPELLAEEKKEQDSIDEEVFGKRGT